MHVPMKNHAAPSELSDEELLERIERLVREEQRVTAKALAEAHAGVPTDAYALDLLRGELSDEEVDELEAANERAHARARTQVR
jgi:hypothetical protein